MKNGSLLLSAVLAVAASHPAMGVSVAVDEYIYPTGLANGSLLSASVDMSYDSSLNILTVVLKNTSPDAVHNAWDAGLLLTGLAFTIPAGTQLTGGSVAATTGSTINNLSVGDTIGEKWGFDNPALQSGVFTGSPRVNFAVSTMQSQTTDAFDPFGASPSVQGPNFGLRSASESSTHGSMGYVVDSLTFDLIFTPQTTIPVDFVDYITSSANWVAVSFGSPGDTGIRRRRRTPPDDPNNPVPDAAATLALLGASMVGVEACRRFFRKQ